jgi:hypothetical protein
MKTVLIWSILACSLASGEPPKPYLPTDAERARWTMSDLRTLATAVEAYALDNKTYPAAATLDALIPMIEPIYVRKAPVVDAWGHPYVYVASADRKSYRLVSAGADGATDAKSWDAAGALKSFDEDAVVSSGAFSRSWPYR